MTIKEAAAKWGCGVQLVAYYCRSGRIQGASKGRIEVWTIPEDASRPTPLKRGRRAQINVDSKNA